MTLKKINVDDLNGLTEPTYKVITQTIQEPNPVKFSALCEEFFKGFNQESLINYALTCILMETPRGQILVYIANIQYWASDEAYKQWLEALNRSNLIIKP